jgi:predicted GNAT family acetyltransferase
VTNSRFLLVQGNLFSKLLYKRGGDPLILVYTGLTPALRGQGIAGLLVETAVRWASQEGLRIVPWCPYARQWLRRNEDLTLGVQIDWYALPRLRGH